MGLNIPIISRSKQCEGEMERISEGYIVLCKDCDGPSDISDMRCFRGLAGRIHPGYNGDIVLRSRKDVSYGGAVIDAFQSFSDIDHMFKVLLDIARNGNISKRVVKMMEKAHADFIEDPLSFQEKKKIYLDNSKDEEITSHLTEIFERTSLMMRKLQKV